MGPAAVEKIQNIVVLIECWEPWSNIYLNGDKSFVSAIDYSRNTQVDVTVTYRGQPLPQHAVGEPFRYLGVLVTLTRDYKFEKQRIMRETRVRLEASLTACEKRQSSLASCRFSGIALD